MPIGGDSVVEGLRSTWLPSLVFGHIGHIRGTFLRPPTLHRLTLKPSMQFKNLANFGALISSMQGQKYLFESLQRVLVTPAVF